MEFLMEALRQERLIMPQLESSVGINGAREEDEFILEIFQGRKKTFKLNRTKYTFFSSDKFEMDFLKAHIFFPIYGNEHGTYELELVANKKNKNHDHKSRYLLRSVGEFPFRLNGTYSFEAFIERGDIVDIGFNRIHFLRPKEGLQDEIFLPEKLIKSSIAILLEGETGTGKTTLAREIHETSGRIGRFVHLNLSSFSSGLIESELFGHVKGAFTGAGQNKRGAIMEADKGTLFLDEIDSLSLDLQTKLLLFFDNNEVRAVGGEGVCKADVRIIVASGTNLRKKVEEKKMRKDFYYRLQSGHVHVLPSLRNHPKRIKDFCRSFEFEQAVVIDDDLINFYSTCSWPGNIRQLKSHLLKKKIFSNGKKIIMNESDNILVSENMESRVLELENILPIEEVKENYCRNVYLKYNRNIVQTARALKMSPNTLRAYLMKWEKKSGDDKVVYINF